MTNGAECKVYKIDFRGGNFNRLNIIWVLFDNVDVGATYCRENRHLYDASINRSCTPILEITRQFRISNKSPVCIIRRQLPLRPAAGKTIHRSQGDTLEEAFVDFPSLTREHMHYVRLSRVRNLTNLHILNFNEHKISVSKKVKEEMSKLRTFSVLKPCTPFLYQYPDNEFFKIFKMCAHYTCILKMLTATDYSVQAASNNIFVETALCLEAQDNDFNIKDFTLYQNDWKPVKTRTKYGTAVYLKNYVSCITAPMRFNYCNVEVTLTMLKEPIYNLHIFGIYCSRKKVKCSQFIQTLKYVHDRFVTDVKTPTIFLGDFNIGLLSSSPEQKAITIYMVDQQEYNQLITQCTTDYGSQLDHIYTNIPALVHYVQVS